MTAWDPERRQVLRELGGAFPGHRVVVVGAVALAHHFVSFRGTRDLDLCIAIDELDHGRDAALPPGWSRDAHVRHRWRTGTGAIVDVVAAAPRLLRAGRIEWPDGTVLDLTGIDVAMTDAARIANDLPETTCVASVRALFLCKVAAWLDRPADRRRDLGDLAVMLDRYVDESGPRLFDDPHLEPDREFDERPAFLLGLDLHEVCAPKHRTRADTFTRLVANRDGAVHAAILAAAPQRWQRDPDAVVRRIAALRAGLART